MDLWSVAGAIRDRGADVNSSRRRLGVLAPPGSGIAPSIIAKRCARERGPREIGREGRHGSPRYPRDIPANCNKHLFRGNACRELESCRVTFSQTVM
jgi:hypothetical protein